MIIQQSVAVCARNQASSALEPMDKEMTSYFKAFLVGGIVLPLVLHLIAPEAMPWWPDTVSFGMAAGAVALSVVWKARADREFNRRVWNALKSLARRPDSH